MYGRRSLGESSKGRGLTFSMNRSVGAKRPLVALAAVKPRVMCGEKMWFASKCEASPPDLMNRSCRHHTAGAYLCDNRSMT